MTRGHPFTVIVTGLLREPERFDKSVASWNSMRDRGLIDRIIAVTWQSEADRDHGFCEDLRAMGVELVVRPDTRVRGIGNIWPQMYAMEIGLDQVDPDARVFKTRTDLWIDPALLEAVTQTPGYLDLAVPDGSAQIFEQRVWVPWFEMMSPFYLSDECFVGRAADLRRLINYDESYSLRFPVACGITHYRRFIHPFRGHSEQFEVFLERFTDTGLGRPDVHAYQRALLEDDAFLRCLAFGYAAIGSHFRFASPAGAIEFREWSSCTPSPGIEPLSDSFDVSRCGLTFGHRFCKDDAWLHGLLSGEHPDDELGARFGSFLGEASRDGLGWMRPGVMLPDVLPAGLSVD